MSLRKLLSGLAAVVLAVPLLAALGAPPGPGWNSHSGMPVKVMTFMPDQAPPGRAVPVSICLAYGPGHSMAYGWPGQPLTVTTTGGALAQANVLTGPRGCATDTLTGLAAGQTIHVTAAWRTLTTGTGVVTGVSQGGSQTPSKLVPSQVPIKVPPKAKPQPQPKGIVPPKPPSVPLPVIKILAPAERRVGQPIPATITIFRRGIPAARAVVTLGTSAGHLSQTTGTTNLLGQIPITVTQAPVGRVTITAHIGTIQGHATVRVLAHPFPWWALLALIGLLALLLWVVHTLRRRRRQGGGNRGTGSLKTL